MKRANSSLVTTILVGATLVLVGATGCSSTTPPPGEPSSSATSSPSESATPSGSPTPSDSATGGPSPSASPPSNAPPQQVEGLTAETGGGSGEVLLRWTQNPENDVVSYIVYRASSSGGSLSRIATVTRQEVTQFEFVPFVDSEVTVGYYRVRAVDSAGQEGPRSSEVCGASYGHSC